jgi:hypothetical protein
LKISKLLWKGFVKYWIKKWKQDRRIIMRKNSAIFLLISFLLLITSCSAGKGNTLNKEPKKEDVVATGYTNSPNNTGIPVSGDEPGK